MDSFLCRRCAHASWRPSLHVHGDMYSLLLAERTSAPSVIASHQAHRTHPAHASGLACGDPPIWNCAPTEPQLLTRCWSEGRCLGVVDRVPSAAACPSRSVHGLVESISYVQSLAVAAGICARGRGTAADLHQPQGLVLGRICRLAFLIIVSRLLLPPSKVGCVEARW